MKGCKEDLPSALWDNARPIRLPGRLLRGSVPMEVDCPMMPTSHLFWRVRTPQVWVASAMVSSMGQLECLLALAKLTKIMSTAKGSVRMRLMREAIVPWGRLMPTIMGGSGEEDS